MAGIRNMKECGRKRGLLQGAVLAFAWKDRGKPQITTVRVVVSHLRFKYSSEMLLLQGTFRSTWAKCIRPQLWQVSTCGTLTSTGVNSVCDTMRPGAACATRHFPSYWCSSWKGFRQHLGESCALYRDVTTYCCIWQFDSMPHFIFLCNNAQKGKSSACSLLYAAWRLDCGW